MGPVVTPREVPISHRKHNSEFGAFSDISQQQLIRLTESHISRKENGEWRISKSLVSIPAIRHSRSRLAELFLPRGYPNSVREGYMRYQLWDLVQGLSTYLRGTLAVKALLAGFGVGDSTTTAVAGALGWIVRDGSAMIGSLLFAWCAATEFGRHVRQWRLFADVVNDIGLTLNMLAPMCGRRGFLSVTCVGSVFASMCTVAAVATKASISEFFAKENNLADCVAKEGTQETAVKIFGLIGGFLIVRWFGSGSPGSVWLIFVLLTVLHLYANTRAVAALKFDFINECRFKILFTAFRDGRSEAMTIKHVAESEPLLPSVRALDVLMGHRLTDMHESLQYDKLVAALGASNGTGDSKYLILFDKSEKMQVMLHPTAEQVDMLKGRFHAECLSVGERTFDELEWARFVETLQHYGWETESNLLSVGLWRYEWKDENLIKGV